MHGQANKVSRGFRTISANIAQMASNTGKLEYTVQGQAKSISLLDENTGDLKNTFEVFEDIYTNGWNEMTNAEKEALGLSIANKTQLEVALSSLNNFESAQRAVSLAIGAQNSAWEENSRYMESIEAKIAKINTEFSNLVLGDGGLTKIVKLILDATAALLEFANTDLGGLITGVGLLTVAVLGLNAAFAQLTGMKMAVVFNGILEAIKFLPTFFALCADEAIGFAGALELLNINPIMLAITLAVGAIYSASKAIDYFVETEAEARQALAEANQEVADATSKVESLTTQLESLKDRIDELEGKELTLSEQQDLDRLKEEQRILERNIKLAEEAELAKKKEAESEAVDLYGKYTRQDDYDRSGTISERLESVRQDIEATKQQIKDANAEIDSILAGTSEYGKEYIQYLQDDIENYNEWLNEYLIQGGDYVSQLNDIADSIEGFTDEGTKVENSINNTIDAYAETVDSMNEVEASTNDLAETSVDLEESEYDIAEQTDEENTSLQDLSSTLTTLASDYQSLQSAVDDYNNGGTMSLETLDALINAATNYSGCLELQNGKLVLSEQYFEALAQQKIANAKADLVMETQTKLATLAEQSQGEVISQTSGVIDTSKASVDDICVSLQNMTGDAITAAQAWNVLKSSMSNEDAGNLEYQQKVNEIRDEFTVQWKTLDEIGSQISGNFDGYASSIAKSSGSAAKSSEDAWLKAYKAEKETIDAMYENGTLSAEQYQEKLLELQAKYLTDTKEHQEKYASEIKSLYEDIYKALKDSVKDSLDEMKDAHDKAEDALKKQHEAQEKSIKNQIELLKRQKEAVEDSYDAQIEALKREREEYENQLELMKLKESLAKAQQQYQYVMNENGRFEWTQDQNAVDEAQEELYEEQLKQAYEKQLQDLEDAKDAAVALYEQQIQDLEDYYDQVQEANDEAEEALEAHNEAIEEQYEKAIEDFDLYAEMLNNGQLAQIESENANWATRLTNLAQFVNSYNAMLAELGNEGATVSPSASFSGGSSSKSSSKTTSGSTTKYKMKKAKVLDVKKHASGVSSISDDELALVGDSPNQELVIGSKLNGVPLSLSSGSGVVNAKSTKTLAGLLNSIPNLGNNYNTTNNNSQHSIHIDTINLPQVQNGNDFVDYLQNFNVDMTANAYRFGS